MVQCSTGIIRIGLLVLLPWPSYSAKATFTLEELHEQLQGLRENYIKLKEDIVAIVAKNAQLEAKDKMLEEKVARLELELRSQEKIQVAAGNNNTPRTCHEIHDTDPSLTSGMYWIDPDGQGVGEAPISVFCDMSTGSTVVSHDSELPMEVDHCPDPGCYSRAINYNGTSIRQLKALAEMSAKCQQSIKYDCNFAPLEFSNAAYSWWNDKDGNPQYFWAGSDSSVHICQCGIDGQCVDAAVKCNCDSMAPVQLTDYGVITDKEILPITRLNFGRTQLDTSSGVHTLGRFECSGQMSETGMTSSCQDLWRKGHTLSGLYSVMGTAMIETVYCDFAKLPSDSGFQTWIGYADVKSSPTYFYAQRNASSFNETKIPIPFDVELLNMGGAMNLTSGKFTAPVAGKYFFSFTGLVRFTGSATLQYCRIFLYKNGDPTALSSSDEISTAAQYETLSLQSTLNLNKGDQIWLEIYSMTPGTNLNGYGYDHFNGFLLEEDISQFVNQFMF
ncbi:uncharacterized protein LOC124326839 [Daphnia pulicaria]|uniref:uncharacterized protein LOC124326839 n=1 Tax=Daphnia pulicaria TaxID=35523 RepID=UPI001EEAB5C8|nr:uncharacterized protein LOC124326839 [Daphnia pulicaria]